jgi:hypothetical protein
VLALFNNGAKSLQASIQLQGADDGEYSDLLGGPPAGVEQGVLQAAIPALGAAWYRLS